MKTTTPPTSDAIAYDRELIASMLDSVLAAGEFGHSTGYTRHSMNEQARLLREADNADAAGVRTAREIAAQGVEGGGGLAMDWRSVLARELKCQQDHYGECYVLMSAGSRLHEGECHMTEGVIKGIEYCIARLEETESSREVVTQAMESKESLVREAIRIAKDMGEWDGKTFNPELHAVMRKLAETSPPHAADALDGERLDWLVSKCVEVREPMRYGSKALFHAQQLNDDDEDHRTDLRAQIDAARAEAGDNDHG